MDLKLTGHVALVQGASKGLGRAIAESLAAEGCDLMLTARTEATLAAAAAEIAEARGRRVRWHAADSSHLAANDAVLDRIRAEFGRLDIIVANSGGPKPGPFTDLTPEDWRAGAELLLVAPAHLLRSALPMLRKSPAPRFFVVTSSSTRVPVANLTLSNTFRPALVGLLKSLSVELAADRVRVHSLAPGRFDTDRLAGLISGLAAKSGKPPEQVRADMVASIPAGRLGEPQELGRLCAFLASPLADYLTGGNWMVDGGLVSAI
jgi:3-oxoacyl-[acyl-carrier protein] reductase